jgi:hypothetical protein
MFSLSSLRRDWYASARLLAEYLSLALFSSLVLGGNSTAGHLDTTICGELIVLNGAL